MKIIFVCKGNMIRSPIAERLFKKELAKRGIKSVYVDSYGLQGFILESTRGKCLMDYPTEYELSKSHLDKKGIDMADHIAKPLSDEVLKAADLVLTMHPDIRKILLCARPAIKNKTLLITELVSKNMVLSDVDGSTNSELYKNTIDNIELCIIKGFDRIINLAETFNKNKSEVVSDG